MLLNTVSAQIDFEAFFSLVKPHGNFSTVAVPPVPIKLAPSTVLNHVCFTGTMIGSPKEITEMLEFCAEKNIAPKIEIVPFNSVNESLQKIRENKPRYRYVLDINSKLEEQYQKK